MRYSKKSVCIIPARGGSKGILKKNLIKINGNSLLSYTVNQAKKSDVDDVIVTSDDPDIEREAWRLDVSTIRRPDDISTDTATTESALTHALNTIDPTGDIYDVVVFMSCTQPYRKISWINTCLSKVKSGDVDSAFVGYNTHKNYWIGLDKLWWEDYSSRQERQPVIQENTGAICATRAEIIREGKRIGRKVYIHQVDEFNLDIHTELDIAIAEAIM